MPKGADPLVAMLDELVVLSDASARARAAQLLERLGAGDLRVALVGEAKRGKSTFGNALLGEEVLPTGVVPVTSISTEVCSGSPRRAEVAFADGRVRTAEVGELECFVSERLNPRNHLKVTGVRVHLPEAMPHQRMVLIDTPGVGSVHQHNTQAAQEAFTTMDAAVFVLTADPPISGSELALLREVATLAVRVFVVLNKADQLESDELPEAAGFVSDVVTEVLGDRPELWICSARHGLRARLAGDEEGWRASGVAGFMDALLTHLVENRERDLRASIATAAERLAARQLDALSVTLAAIEALDTDQQDRLAEFGARLDAVDLRRAEAEEFVTAHLRGERRRLDEDAATQIRRASAQARERLDAYLGGDDRRPGELEERGRTVIAETIRAAVETWRAEWHTRCQQSYAQLTERQRRLLEEAGGDLHTAARDLLGVRLQSEVPVLASPELPDLHYDFDPEVGWNHALVSGMRTRAPAGVARRRVEKYLREEAARMVDKHLGRARADFQSLLEDAGRRLRSQIGDAFAQLTDGLRSGHQAALDLRRLDEVGHRSEQERLAGHQLSLAQLVDGLRDVAPRTATARIEAEPERAAATRMSSAPTEEENR
jgi:GTP-binding protein EngB required for normal cell division